MDDNQRDDHPPVESSSTSSLWSCSLLDANLRGEDDFGDARPTLRSAFASALRRTLEVSPLLKAISPLLKARPVVPPFHPLMLSEVCWQSGRMRFPPRT